MAHRNVTPVNLKERIALLQQKAAASGSSSSQPSADMPVSLGAPSISPPSSAASIPIGSSGSALRERIAKFEKKGGVPVPRGSFGLGAPPPALKQTHEGAAARKKGELYGNRIASVKSHATGSSGSTSPPSMILHRHLTGNAEINAAASRSLISSSSSESSSLGLGGLSPGDGSPAPMRVRVVSTSSLATNGPGGEIIMSGTFDEGESTVNGIGLTTAQLFIPDDSKSAESQLSRHSSVSDATQPHVSESPYDSTQSPRAKDGSVSPSHSQSEAAGTPRKTAVPELADDRDHVVQKDYQQMPRADSVADSDATAAPEQGQGLGTVACEPGDESFVKTPVVASFSFSAQSIEHSTSSPLSDSASLLEASFGVGERVYSETRRLVVIPPSASKDATIDSVLDHAATQAATHDEDKQENTGIAEERSVSALGISGTQESRGSTETIGASTVSHSTDTTERTFHTPQSTGSASIRRHAPPAPLVFHQENYVEPSLDPKVGPKSFRAVVHGKTTEPVRTEASQTVVPRARVPVIITRPRDSIPGTPRSPDLSALLAQAMYLEQKLEKGDMGIGTPADENTSQPAPRPVIKIDTNNASRQSQIPFPQNNSISEGPAPPSKDSLRRRMSQSLFSQKGSNRSSGNASSEDSVPVRTPPSPTFDLVPPSVSEEPHEIQDEHEKDEQSEPEGRRSISSVLSSPGRSARKKVLSIFGRSGRSGSNLTLPDDPANESTYSGDSNHDSGSNSGHGSISVSVCPSSTLPPSPVHNNTIQTPSPISPSLSFRNRLRVREDTPDVPRPVSEVSTTSYSSTASRLAVDLFDAFPDVPHSVPSSLDQDRPDDLNGGREVVPGIEVRLEDVKEDPDEPYSPPPPTPPLKSFDSPRTGHATPPVPVLQADQLPSRTSSRYPPPPYPPSTPRKESLSLPRAPSSASIRSMLSLPRKSKSKPNLKIPNIPYFSSSTPSSSRHVREKSDGSCLTASSTSDMMHAPYPPSSFPSNFTSSASTPSPISTSIFGAISRSLTLSGRRARSRKNSSTSSRSIFGSAHGSSTSLPR